MGYFSSHRARHGVDSRFGLTVYGTKGILSLNTGSLPAVHYVEDPSWAPGASKAVDGSDERRTWAARAAQGLLAFTLGTCSIVKDLIQAIETDRSRRAACTTGGRRSR